MCSVLSLSDIHKNIINKRLSGRGRQGWPIAQPLPPLLVPLLSVLVPAYLPSGSGIANGSTKKKITAICLGHYHKNEEEKKQN